MKVREKGRNFIKKSKNFMKISEDINDKKINIENSNLIYKEATFARNQQHEDIMHLNQKINWILASDIIFFGFLLQVYSRHNFLYIIAAALLIASLVVCCWSLFARNYKMGPNLIDLHKKRTAPEIDFIDSTNNRIIKDLGENRYIVNNLVSSIKIAIILLILSVLLVFIKFFNLCHI
jgi:hypothetical protein